MIPAPDGEVSVYAGLNAEVDRIISYVQANRGWGLRASRRYVARYLTPDSLAYWRAEGSFPGRSTTIHRRKKRYHS